MSWDLKGGVSAPDAPSGAPPAQLRHLRKRWQFLACAKGKSLARGGVVIQILPRADDDPAIGVGFTATKKVGGAVVRNRAKRRLREAARQLLPLHGSPSHDYVFVARVGAVERPWPRLLDDAKLALLALASGGGDDPRPYRSKSMGRSKATSAGKKSPDGQR
jgi:ribonuclease P protein component